MSPGFVAIEHCGGGGGGAGHSMMPADVDVVSIKTITTDKRRF